MPATQIVEFGAPQSQTLTVRLFSAGSDNVVQTASAVAAKSNDSGDYAATFTDVPAGVYKVKAFTPANVQVARWWVNLAATSGTYPAYEMPQVSSGSATIENQQAILDHLVGIKGTGWTSADSLKAIQDLVSAGVGSALASLGFTTGTITGFPTTLRVGDSYVAAVNRAIAVFVRDQNNTPIVSLGSKNFSDADFAPSVTISQEGNAGRVECQVSWVPPGGSEGYLLIQIPSALSKSARVGTATVQTRLRWTGIDVTIATQAVTWLPAV